MEKTVGLNSVGDRAWKCDKENNSGSARSNLLIGAS